MKFSNSGLLGTYILVYSEGLWFIGLLGKDREIVVLKFRIF